MNILAQKHCEKNCDKLVKSFKDRGFRSPGKTTLEKTSRLPLTYTLEVGKFDKWIEQLLKGDITAELNPISKYELKYFRDNFERDRLGIAGYTMAQLGIHDPFESFTHYPVGLFVKYDPNERPDVGHFLYRDLRSFEKFRNFGEVRLLPAVHQSKLIIPNSKLSLVAAWITSNQYSDEVLDLWGNPSSMEMERATLRSGSLFRSRFVYNSKSAIDINKVEMILYPTFMADHEEEQSQQLSHVLSEGYIRLREIADKFNVPIATYPYESTMGSFLASSFAFTRFWLKVGRWANSLTEAMGVS